MNVYKYFLKNQNLAGKERFKIMLLQQVKSFDWKTQQKSACRITTYTRAINRLTGLSPSSFRKTYSQKLITGFKKSSW